MADMTAAQREALERLQKSMSLQFLDPRTLTPNDMNPKKHPTAQRKALRAFRDELQRRADAGQAITPWVDTAKWNRRTGRLWDGHMRQIQAIEDGEELIPVLVFDVDEETENLLLAFTDLIGSMFERDQTRETELLETMEIENQELAALLKDADEPEPEVSDDAPKKRTELPPGGLALPLGMKFNYVVLLFKTETDWAAAQDLFALQRQQCPFSGYVGTGRVVDGGVFLAKLQRGEFRNSLGLVGDADEREADRLAQLALED